MEGEAPTPPLYTVVTQTMPPPATETGMMTRELEIAHTKNLVMARIGALTQGAGIEVWMLQNFIRSLGANRKTLSRMHEARLLIECINASVRYRAPIHFRVEPGVSSPNKGTIKERRDCKVSFSIIASIFANEVVLRKGFGYAKLVCTAYRYAAPEGESAAAITTCCAALKAWMPTGHMRGDVPKGL